MSLNKNLTCGIVIALMLSACGQKNHRDSNVTLVSASKIANSGAPAKEKAEEYGKAAELLLTAQGFPQAHQLSALGLREDPKNLRSGFIHALSGIMMTQKGIYARVWPLMEKSPALLEKHKQEIANTEDKSGKEMIKFLMDGKADIRSEIELQDHLDSTAKAIEHFRQFIHANKDKELTIKGNTTLIPDLIERYAEACEIKETANLEYELICPPHQGRYDVTLNRADFEVLGYMAAITKMYVLMTNAYDLSGSVVVSVKYPEDSASPETIVAELSKNPAFGKLRKKARLQEIKSLGLDLVGGLNWANKNQNTLCPKRASDSKNRVGKLINKGFCTYGDLTAELKIMETTFKGETMASTSNKGDESYTANAAYGAFFLKPPQDLRSLGPYKFDACRTVIGVGDVTLGGIFPDGDANKVLPLASPTCGVR